MTSEGWYWCFTHERVEGAGERDDPDNTLGPYATAVEAADWRARVEERNERWREDDEAWSGDEPEDGLDTV
jgi:hypothetical protein